MKIEYPKQYESFLVEKLLGNTIKEKYHSGKLGKNALLPLSEAISLLSENYIQESGLPRKRIDQKIESIAYALYFGQFTAAKLLAVLPHLSSHFEAESILDIGCGPGTSLLALKDSFSIHSYTGVDSSDEMLKTAKVMFPQHTFQRKIPKERHSLIILSNVLAEISEQEKFIEEIFDRLLPNGRIVIIEPGTKDFTQKLMKLRDVLIQKELLFPIFPCTHSQMCPMRSNEHDWCHTELNWQRPSLVEELDGILGFNKHKLKFSCLILTSKKQKETQISRIVSPLSKSKKGVSTIICSKEYYGEKLLEKSLAKKSGWFSILE